MRKRACSGGDPGSRSRALLSLSSFLLPIRLAFRFASSRLQLRPAGPVSWPRLEQHCGTLDAPRKDSGAVCAPFVPHRFFKGPVQIPPLPGHRLPCISPSCPQVAYAALQQAVRCDRSNWRTWDNLVTVRVCGKIHAPHVVSASKPPLLGGVARKTLGPPLSPRSLLP